MNNRLDISSFEEILMIKIIINFLNKYKFVLILGLIIGMLFGYLYVTKIKNNIYKCIYNVQIDRLEDFKFKDYYNLKKEYKQKLLNDYIYNNIKQDNTLWSFILNLMQIKSDDDQILKKDLFNKLIIFGSNKLSGNLYSSCPYIVIDVNQSSYLVNVCYTDSKLLEVQNLKLLVKSIYHNILKFIMDYNHTQQIELKNKLLNLSIQPDSILLDNIEILIRDFNKIYFQIQKLLRIKLNDMVFKTLSIEQKVYFLLDLIIEYKTQLDSKNFKELYMQIYKLYIKQKVLNTALDAEVDFNNLALKLLPIFNLKMDTENLSCFQIGQHSSYVYIILSAIMFFVLSIFIILLYKSFYKN